MIDNNYKFSSVDRVVDDDLGLILKRRDTFLHQKHISSTKIYTGKILSLKPMNACKD